ncbi:MAG: LysR family transcriptional regulator [Neomegalonema sp.]|nr:LysR family transcriptional regulator [Neomegalonema sp.]
MARNLDLAALRSFVAVAETGGVTRAAQRLNLTQSGVSMQLKRLEEALDTKLFSRDGRGVALTRQGEELLKDARRLIALNDEIWARMTRPEAAGQLVLGMPYDIVGLLAPPVIKRFTADHPDVKVSLLSPPTTELLQLFDAGQCDVIVTTEFDVGRGGETLATRPLVWVGAIGGRAWQRSPTPLAFDQRCAFRKIAFNALEMAGIAWDWPVDVCHSDAMTASIGADLAIAAMMRGTEPPGLSEVAHNGALPPLPEVIVNMYVAPGPNEPLARSLGDYVRGSINGLDQHLRAQGRVA